MKRILCLTAALLMLAMLVLSLPTGEDSSGTALNVLSEDDVPVKVPTKPTHPGEDSDPGETEPPASSEPAETEPPASSEPAETEPPASSEPAETEPPAATEPEESTAPAEPSAPAQEEDSGGSNSGDNKKGNSGSSPKPNQSGTPSETEAQETAIVETEAETASTEETEPIFGETEAQEPPEEEGMDLKKLLPIVLGLIAMGAIIVFLIGKKREDKDEPEAAAAAQTAQMQPKDIPAAPDATVAMNADKTAAAAAGAAAAGAAAVIPPVAAAPVLMACGQTGVFAGKKFVANRQLRFGRGGGNDIAYPANTPGISGSHCALLPHKDGLVLVDLGSTYGTYLSNGTRLKPNHNYLLKRGDAFCLGNKDQIFRIE